jgi:hypothetical protein
VNRLRAAALGGVLAGVVTTAVMVAGRKSGIFGKTLDRDSVDWIDRHTGSRAAIGDTGTSLLEFGNHLAASAAFGLGYAELRERLPAIPPAALGALYGTALYLVNIAGIAPVLGITKGEIQAGPRKAAERWFVHVVQTVATALIAERLTSRSAA